MGRLIPSQAFMNRVSAFLGKLKEPPPRRDHSKLLRGAKALRKAGFGAKKAARVLCVAEGADIEDCSAEVPEAEKNLLRFRRDLCHPDVQMTTPGTRIRWRTLRQWLAGWRTIEHRQRKPSAKGDQAERAHLDALGQRIDLVKDSEDPALLRELVALLRARRKNGERSPVASALLVEAQNRLRQLGQDNRKLPQARQPLIYQGLAVGSVGRQQERLLDQARLAEAGIFVRRLGRARGAERWEVWGEGIPDAASLAGLGGRRRGDGRWVFERDPTPQLATRQRGQAEQAA